MFAGSSPLSSYRFAYDPQVLSHDLRQLDAAIRLRIRDAIDTKLGTDPERFGSPLRRGLKGFRKLRVGDWRVVFRLEGLTVHILIIGHRRDVYESAKQRTG